MDIIHEGIIIPRFKNKFRLILLKPLEKKELKSDSFNATSCHGELLH